MQTAAKNEMARLELAAEPQSGDRTWIHAAISAATKHRPEYLIEAAYITLESRLSSMSRSPARSFASAAPEGLWNSLWIYFTAPPVGMMLAAHVYIWLRGKHAAFRAKLHHYNGKVCIFRCNFQALLTPITIKETM